MENKFEHDGRSPPPVAIDVDTHIDVDAFPDYQKINAIKKYTRKFWN
jgi:hypothetical protein